MQYLCKLLTLLKYVTQPRWAPQAREPLCFAHAAQSIATPLSFPLELVTKHLIILALKKPSAFYSYPSWAADWRAFQETHTKRRISSSETHWRSSVTRLLSRGPLWPQQNWTSVNFVFNFWS